MSKDRASLDAILRKLRSSCDPNVNYATQPSPLTVDEVRWLCNLATDRFKTQRSLLQLDTPMIICGDIHGQFHDLVKLFEIGGTISDTNSNRYLFMGDYVDRGKQSLEVICYLFALTLRFPDKLFLLRGNHESASVTKMYGFFDECKRRFPAHAVKGWRSFIDCFNYLPISAIVGEKIFCTHGGLSPELVELGQIDRIMRPQDIPDNGLLCDLLWSDPAAETGVTWEENNRGCSYTFGRSEVDTFLSNYSFELICRAHQVVEDGYEFQFDRKLVTVFSAAGYADFNNAGAIMTVSSDLLCSFKIYGGLTGR